MYFTIWGIQFDYIIRLCESDFNPHNLCTSQQPHMGIQFDLIGLCECDFNFQNLFTSLQFHLGVKLNLIKFYGCDFGFLNLLQVSYTSIWESNLTSLDYVGMILIFKGL